MIAGYARVSTEDQNTEAQKAALRAAGCTAIFQDTASGADRNRPELARCLKMLGKGDTLVVARLDRIARSLSHLLEITEGLDKRGIQFKSLADPFDTSSAQGRLMMQMLGSFAEFERDLIRERTKAGLQTARRAGRVGGNPRFKARDRSAIALMKATQADTYTQRARERSAGWIHLVRRLRPQESWESVLIEIKRLSPSYATLKVDTVVRNVKRLIAAGDLDESVLERAPRPVARQAASTTLALWQLRREHPKASVRRLGELLIAEGHRPLLARTWSTKTLRNMLKLS